MVRMCPRGRTEFRRARFRAKRDMASGTWDSDEEAWPTGLCWA